MESRQRNSRWTVGMGSVAMALLLLGGTAAFADGQQCYSCGSWCTEQGVVYGIWMWVANPNDPNNPAARLWVRVGGTGWENCRPGTQCWTNVGAACRQKCNDCIAAGGHYGGPDEQNPTYKDCTPESGCSIDTGFSDPPNPEQTSVCLDFCLCNPGKYCRDTQIVGGGWLSTQNSVCKCPP